MFRKLRDFSCNMPSCTCLAIWCTMKDDFAVADADVGDVAVDHAEAKIMI